MKILYCTNNELLEILADKGIIMTCNADMDIEISDDDSERIKRIVTEFYPAANSDYSIEDKYVNG